jgi:hypothetical protein
LELESGWRALEERDAELEEEAILDEEAITEDPFEMQEEDNLKCKRARQSCNIRELHGDTAPFQFFLDSNASGAI